MTLVKSFPYRGDTTEEFSNRYYFDNAVPASTSGWDSLRDALIAEEKKVYPSFVTVIRCYGYDDDDKNADSVYQSSFTAIPGTIATLTGAQQGSGDSAVWLRWGTARLVKGKRVYLRKYFHPAFAAAVAGNQADATHAVQLAALNAFGLKLRDGTFIDGRKIRARTSPALPISHMAGPYVTTRTLHRRGKRNPTTP